MASKSVGTPSRERGDEPDFVDWPDFMYESKSLSMWDRNISETTPISVHTAATLGDENYIEGLINSGKVTVEDLSRVNKSGWTPLMYACSGLHERVVHLLMAAGVDVNCPGIGGLTPLMIASKGCNSNIVESLANEKNINTMDDAGWTALCHAVHMDQEKIVAILLVLGADVNHSEPIMGRTVLMLAAASSRLSVVNTLLNHGADTRVVSKLGETALTVAEENGNHAVAERLKRLYVLRTRPQNLRDLLASVNYGCYCLLFEEQGIDLEKFLALTEADLKALGIKKVGVRKTLAEIIDLWREGC